MNPLTTEQVPTKSETYFWKFFSSGTKTKPAKINGISRRCSPEEIDKVPQKESDIRTPQGGTSFSFVPKSNWGLSRKAVATESVEISTPKVIVPIIKSVNVFFPEEVDYFLCLRIIPHKSPCWSEIHRER